MNMIATKTEFEEILNDLFNRGVLITNFNVSQKTRVPFFEADITLDLRTTDWNFVQALMDFGRNIMYQPLPILKISDSLEEADIDAEEVDNFSETD